MGFGLVIEFAGLLQFVTCDNNSLLISAVCTSLYRHLVLSIIYVFKSPLVLVSSSGLFPCSGFPNCPHPSDTVYLS
jgi:hypothetical protein